MSYYLVNPKDKTTIYGFIANPDKKELVKAFSYLEHTVIEVTTRAIQHLLDYHKCELTQNPYRDNTFIPVERLIKQKKVKT